jgi:hypothetical protein
MIEEQGAINDVVDRTKSRIARADHYFKEHLGGQQNWYDAKASRYKDYAQWLSLTVLIAGGLTGFIQIFAQKGSTGDLPAWPAVVTALLALAVVVGEGLGRMGRYRETWASYRKASEQMKREYRLYINNAGDYENEPDEDTSYGRFVENIEQIIAEEQQLYWQGSTSKGGGSGGSSGDAGGKR